MLGRSTFARILSRVPTWGKKKLPSFLAERKFLGGWGHQYGPNIEKCTPATYENGELLKSAKIIDLKIKFPCHNHPLS